MNVNTWSSLSSLLVLLLVLLLVADRQHIANAMRTCEVKLFRLPTHIQPSNYKLILVMHPSANIFRGTVEIDLNIRDTLDSEEFLLARTIGTRLDPLVRDPRNIILNADKLEVVDVKFEQGGHSLGQAGICHDKNNKILVLTLDRAPSPRVAAKMYFEFWGTVHAEAKGLFRSSFGSSHTLATHFKPAYARRLFPCFDEPQFKATFDLTILHPEGTIALSNMPIIRHVPDRFGLVTTEYERTPKMSSYLLGLAVGDFDLIESDPLRDGKKIVIYAPKGRANSARYILGKAVQAYDKAADFFADLPQPLGKIDIVAVNMERGAIENWGLITMRWGLLCEELAKPDDRNYAVTALTNVIVRFWLGNMVTVHWWDDLWFMEGLAKYLTSELTAELHPEIGSELFTLINTFSAMDDDNDARRSRAIGGEHFRTADVIEKSFNSIKYKKSEAVFRMFASYIGKSKFNKAILSFVHQHSYGLVAADDWLRILLLDAPNHNEMVTMFRQWTEQAGYPIITVTQLKAGELILRQKSNLFTRQIWSVPIIYELHRNNKIAPHIERFLLSEKGPKTIKLPEKFNLKGYHKPWIKLNVNFHGYYRVVYRSKRHVLKNALANAVESGYMQAADQLQLLSDYYACVKRGDPTEDFHKLLVSFSMSKKTADEVMLLLTRMLSKLHNRNWPLARSDLVEAVLEKYHRNNGGVLEPAGSDTLKQYARGCVLDYLVNVLRSSRVIEEAQAFMRSTGGKSPLFLEHVLNKLPQGG